MRILLQFKHGLGDAVSFTIVLKHLRHYHPDWFIGVEALEGIHSCFYNLANQVHILKHPLTWRKDYEQLKPIRFARVDNPIENYPQTKPTRCLIEEFHLKPLPETQLYDYEIHPTQQAKEVVARFIEEEVKGDYGIIHYQGGKSCPGLKNLSTPEAQSIINKMRNDGLRVVVLDLAYQTNHDDVIRVDRRHPYLWHGQREGDAGTIAELIRGAKVLWGIDSGVEHVAAAIASTPTNIIWKKTKPVRCFDPMPFVVHYVPFAQSGDEFFEAYYNHRYYFYFDQILELAENEIEPEPVVEPPKKRRKAEVKKKRKPTKKKIDA